MSITNEFASKSAAFEEEDSQKDKYLTFRIANENFGIEIAYVTEIVGMQTITEVPGMPDYVKGVINLRGRVIPILDVRLRFRMQERPYDDRTCVIVVNLLDMTTGLIVDRVNEVLDIPEDAITLPPNLQASGDARYIRGMGKVGDDVVILLNMDRFLKRESIDEIASGLPA